MSGIRPPSKIPAFAPGRELTELSASQNNARPMGPPQIIGAKHKTSHASEPAPKRKTLADRAGEPYHQKYAAPPSDRYGALATTIQAGPKHTSFSASTSKVPAGSSRIISANSHGVGSTGRPRSQHSQKRPTTAMGHTRINSYHAGASSRPVTSMSHYGATSSQPSEAEQNAWDVSARVESVESLYVDLKNQMQGTSFERNNFREMIELMKTRITELESVKVELMANNEMVRMELEECRVRLATSNITIDDIRRGHSFEVDELHRNQRNEVAELQSMHNGEVERLRRQMQDLDDQLRRNGQEEIDRLLRSHREDLAELDRRFNGQIEDERRARAREVQDLTQQRDMQLQSIAIDIGKRDREAEALREQTQRIQSDLDRQKDHNSELKAKLSESSGTRTSLESSMAAMKAKIDFLESDHQQQSQAFADLHKRMQEAIEQESIAKEKLIHEETLRRKLHNQVQELKGNIRVFCRVRPTLDAEVDDPAKIAYPDAGEDSKEIHVQGPEQVSSLGKVTSANNAFSFDCVFGPKAQNAEVFDEISQLVQSALDGYNVCIFCYGQTGSGKTFTMSAPDGMIPRAVTQIYECAKKLEERGWTYKMEGSFVEVYNENLNDLLGKAEEIDKKKHEIRHDSQTCKTTITDITTLLLDSPERMEGLLQRAQKNRSVAATKANERSSRSHCVFILNLVGENSITGERSEGTLNLVDLAGSERLSHSGAEGARLKETQNINKSLSCLGDVIAALGDGKASGHIPYRNSKLTYLLQYSLGGNSKTLMFVMVSPLQAHLTDTLTSLKFAKKVHSTHIGTARKQTKVKD